ncbi:ABC transporter ATP-binding protein [Candidatus Woesebacteria bacterium]|nr:ABC transporter ATP-binding protein [Candidatus Woesebacteria bacterium]
MKKLSSLPRVVHRVAKNLGAMLSFAWRMDKFLTTGFYITAGLGAFSPIITSYIFKLLVDYLVKAQNVQPTIPFILVAILASRYVVDLTWDFIQWGLNGTYFSYLFRYKLQNSLTYSFYEKVSSLDIAHHEDAKTQDLIAKASDTFTWRIPDFLRQFSNLFNNFVGYIVSFVVLIPYGWEAPVILTILVLPRFMLRTRFGKLEWSIYGSTIPDARKLWYYRRLLSDRGSVAESRIFQSTNELLKRLRKLQDQIYELHKKPVYDFLKVIIYPSLLEVIIVFLFAYSKLPDVLAGSMSIGDFTFYISILGRLATEAADMVFNFGDMYESNLYVDHYFEVLRLPKIIKQKGKTIEIPQSPAPPKIEFKNVSFVYPGSKNKVLKDVNFTIEPAENIAIVGKNGAGKTTIVKLLCRFYDIDSGEILINGVNIKDVSLNEWYKYLGTLFQNFIHYNFTVAENIMLGNPNVQDEQKMKLAARMSGSDEFIHKLPKKYNQMLGRQFEGGKELSQGQWQKLAIARAFYEAAPILILDEPTSAIDAEAEYEIFKNLQRFYKDKTLFLISHRFSTVRHADKIIVLDEGKIIEEGEHEDLVTKDGLYARMFKKQAIGYR